MTVVVRSFSSHCGIHAAGTLNMSDVYVPPSSHMSMFVLKATRFFLNTIIKNNTILKLTCAAPVEYIIIF